MTSQKHQYVPLKDPYVIPVHWEFSRDDYNKLAKGNEESKSPWRCFMENDVFHIYKGFIGGLEWYRFALKKQANSTYVVSSLETLREPDSDDVPAELLDDTQPNIKVPEAKYGYSTIREVAEVLLHSFDEGIAAKVK